ncbi:hypothetical protein BD626DRAFT_546139 [Schizophyllum amplum]|uniref:NACHT domain-containing protein n=1 Tax=Schizophyllum amplum TaxID=97359 RepID=A0A550CR45_9AGAR|nr:hypothetical protein BD626DRAFT_546139 [Auriculariopsis ampla]
MPLMFATASLTLPALNLPQCWLLPSIAARFGIHLARAELSTTPAADSQSTVPAIPPPAPPPRPAPADPLAALWEEAIERYKSETGIDMFAQDSTRFVSESAILHYLDEQEKTFAQFRADGPQRLRTALAPVAGACGPLCAIAGEGVGLVFAPSKVLFTAIGELVKAAVKVSEELDSIVGAFDTIEHHLRILKPAAARDLLHDEALREASVKLLAQILVVFGVIQKVQNDGRLVLWLKKLAGSKQVSSALDDLGRLATNQHQTISAVTLYTAKETMAILIEGDASHQHEHELTRKSLAEITKIAQEVHDMVRQNTDATQGQTSVNRGVLENIQRTLLRQINDMNMDRNTANIEKILQWLQYSDSSVKMNSLLDDRAESTGSWFLDGDEYSAFKRGERKCLWLHGKAGCGKSTMIAAVIRDLQVRAACSATTALTITHLFDTTNGSQPRNLRALLSSFLCQLAYSRGECATNLLKLRTGASVGDSQLSLEMMRHHLDAMLESTAIHVLIIVDALDEADDDRIISFLAHLRTHTNVSLLLSSRHEVLFQADLQGLSDTEIPMREDLINEDIMVVLEQFLHSGGALDIKTNQDIKDRIKQVIRMTADGNFRWAALQLRELGAVAGIPRKVLQRLENIPKTLGEDYERRLQAIDSSDRQDVLCLLIWSLFSHRPLSTSDFAQLLSFDYSERMPVFNTSMQPSSVIDVLSLIGSTFICERDGIIRIAHASVKNYLIELPPSSPYYVDPNYVYSMMARTCLAYLKAAKTMPPTDTSAHPSISLPIMAMSTSLIFLSRQAVISILAM